MKKFLKSSVALAASLSVFTGSIPFSADAYNFYADISDLSYEYGDYMALEFYPDYIPEILADSELEDYMIGAHLDANNKAVYDAFLKLVEPSLDSFTINLPEPLVFTYKMTEDINSNEEFRDLIFENCGSGMEAASFDEPMIFWLEQRKTSIGIGKYKVSTNYFKGTNTLTISSLKISPGAFDAFTSFENILEYKEKLETAVDEFVVKGETNEQKLRSIHDQICLFTDYDLEGPFQGSAISALVEPGAVCEGYSKGFKLICDKIGIPCVCVFGNYDEEMVTAHMWNYVRMEDGKWYAVDTTWNDSDGLNGLEILYRYFLSGKDTFYDKHTENNDYTYVHLEYPELAEVSFCEPYAPIFSEEDPTVTTTTTTTKPTTTTTVKTTTTTKPTTTTTAKPTTTTTKKTTTTAKPTTTTAKKTTTTAKTTTTTTKSTTTTTAKTTTTTKPTTTTTAKPTTTTAKKTTTTAKPTTTTAKKTTTTAKPTTTTAKKTTTKPVTTTKVTESIHGDLNNDGVVSIADLVICSQEVMGISRMSGKCDMNGDSITDVFDVIVMREVLIEEIASRLGIVF